MGLPRFGPGLTADGIQRQADAQTMVAGMDAAILDVGGGRCHQYLRRHAAGIVASGPNRMARRTSG